jgi:DNA (cytosine-5)-methyltransferase 1
MRYLRICSGIEAASVAWEPLGWIPLAFSEIEAFPRAVLAYHYPDVRLWGDFNTLRHEPWIVDADVLVGGTPCQGFSVAGLRGSLADDRSNLCLQFVGLANAIDDLRRHAGRSPAYILWENVPGVFSTDDNAFGCFLAGLVGSESPLTPHGGRWTNAGVVTGPRRVAAWRVLDAQHFGLAQRRKRVFVLSREHPGGWAVADALLPITQSLRGDPAPSRQAGQGTACPITNLIAPPITSNPYGDHESREGRLVAFGGNNTAGPIDIATAVNSHGGPHGRQDFESETFIAHTLRGEGFDASEDGTGRGTPLVPVAYRTSGNCGAWDTGDRVDALTTSTDPNSHILAFDTTQITSPANRSNPRAGDPCHLLAAGAHAPAIAFALRGREGGAQAETHDAVSALRSASGGSTQDYVAASAVRRLTPVECEKLQGFSPGWTAIQYRGALAADGPRYKALGNSFAVPVVRWIGLRIQMVEQTSLLISMQPSPSRKPAK